jgi:hypothetical protein
MYPALRRCIRTDLVSSVPLSRAQPTWVQPPYGKRSQVMGWMVDERLSTFIAMSQVGTVMLSTFTAESYTRDYIL